MRTYNHHPETGLLTPTAAALNLAVRFFVEIGAYASLAYWGASVGTTGLCRGTLAVLAPLSAIGIWSLYLAPRARRGLPDPAALFAELAIFGASSVALASTGQVALAAVLGSTATVNTLLVRVLGQRRRAATV